MNKSTKITLITILSVYLMGCGDSGEYKINTTSRFDSMTTSCLEGVVYYSSSRHLALAYNRDGSIKTCEDE